MRTRLLILLCFVSQFLFAASGHNVSGTIKDAATSMPVSGAVIKVDNGAFWAVSDIDGKYTISIPDGKYLLTVECLGYVTRTLNLLVSQVSNALTDMHGERLSFNIELDVESLALDEVTVTAQRPSGTMGTSHNIGAEALQHLQMSGMSDMTSLLPGGKTINPDLTQDNTISLRDGGTSAGNAAFGTAVEVDGVRIENNASVKELSGASTRSVAVENIESIEVITGVPSAEYGDLNSGMVKVHTKRGRSPLNISFSANPRTLQASLSKGIDFSRHSGVLNISGEWVRATTKLVSPYTAYNRYNAGATYSDTYKNVFHYEVGVSANIGGMDAKDDPDANNGNTSKARDNAFRAHANLNWMLNRSWITNLKFDASLAFVDNLERSHTYNSSASSQPAVHSEVEGYYFAAALPLEYYADQVVDSKELGFSAALKYDWTRSFGPVKNRLKAGLQYKSNGNVGQGEYYENPALSPNGYRPRPYTLYPFMHNFSQYLEDQVTVPVGNTKLEVVAGLRFEQVAIKGTRYKDMNLVSPRLNAKWSFGDHWTLRGGWGVSGKLPSFWVLYPKQEYMDIQTFSFSSGSSANYAYYTVPFQLQFNENLRWQKNYNSELGIDMSYGQWKISLVGFYNVTKDPYQFQNVYTPVSLNMMRVPSDFQIPQNPQFTVDSQTGMVYLRGEGDYWTPMESRVTDRTFVKSLVQTNGKPVYRAGAELTIDFPQIRPIRTSFRMDAKYSFSTYVDDLLSYYYNAGWKHSSLSDRSYEYVGIYARGASTNTSNGKTTHALDANLTSITHIPAAKLVFTIRLETAILRRSRNLSRYNGGEYAFNVAAQSDTPTGGSIYDGNSYAAIYPVQYMDLDGKVHDFTAAQASDPAFDRLIVRSGNAYTYNPDGYGFYCSANFSVTKEIGKHFSVSMFANNFTATRPAVKSMATGVSVVFTPAFYYGITLRVKI